MWIPGNVALFAQRQIGLHQNRATKALRRLSSGYRINSAADDPAGLAISERMRAQITAMRQAARNARDGQSMLNTADGTLAEAQRVANRLVEIANHAATGTLNQTQRNALQEEANQLLEALNQAGEGAHFAGQTLLAGESEHREPTRLQVGTGNQPHDKLDLKLPQINSVRKLLEGFDVSSPEAARTALSAANQAVDQLSGMRGQVGAQGKAMEYTINNLDQMADNLEDAESRIRDADMAKEMMEFAKGQFLGQAASFALAHAMHQPERELELLKKTAE